MNDVVTARIKKTWTDFWSTYRLPAEIKSSYIPKFFDTLFADDDTKPSGPALRKIISSKSVSYVGSINQMHKLFTNMYGAESLQEDPQFLEYQYAESIAWLLIHIIDDVGERLARAGGKSDLKDVTNYVDTLLFDPGAEPKLDSLDPTEKEALDYLAAKCRKRLNHLGALSAFKKPWQEIVDAAIREDNPKTMEEYRKAKVDVGVYSARFCNFFVCGGADDNYAKRHYGDKVENLKFTSDQIGAAGQCFDGFLDFGDDKFESMRDLKTARGDRSWFLMSTMKTCLNVLIKEQIKHIGHFTGFATYNVRANLTPYKKKYAPEYVDALVEQALAQQAAELSIR